MTATGERVVKECHLGPVWINRDGEANGGELSGAPDGGGDHDGSRPDGAVCSSYARNLVCIAQYLFDRAFLADVHAGPAGGQGQRLGGHHGVDVHGTRLVGVDHILATSQSGLQVAGGGGIDDLGWRSDGGGRPHSLLDQLALGGASDEKVAGLRYRYGQAEAFRETEEAALRLQLPPGRPGVGDQSAADAGSAARLAGSDHVTLEENHAADAQLTQLQGGGEAVDPAANDDHVGCLKHLRCASPGR